MAGFKEYQMLFSLNAKTEGSFRTAFNSGSTEVSRLQGSINALNKVAGDISSYQKQEKAIENTKLKIERYRSELETLKSAIPATAKEEAELTNKIAEKDAQLKTNEKTLSAQEQKLNQMADGLKKAGVNVDNLATAQDMLKEKTTALKNAQMDAAGSTNNLSNTMKGLQDALVAIGAEKAISAVYNGLKECSEASAAFETSMAAVKRTVGGDDQFIDSMGESFKQLSTEMPITANELAAIATTAGQLGIAQDRVEQFTTVMAQLATTTDLSADSAATMLAQFANITGATDYARLGSTVAALGDSTATTASKVVEMSQGMAAAANIAGMGDTDILAIAAAVGSLGIEAQAGSTAMSQLITTLYKSTETGEKLEDFAAVANMSAGEFAKAWSESPVEAMNAFIQGLNDTERNGKSAMVILDELGISNVRQTKAILGLASAGDLLSDTITQANAAWNSNTALTEKAGIMYDTTEAKLAMLQNSTNNLSIAVGDALNPAIGAGASMFSGLLEPVTAFIEKNPQIIQGLATAAGAFGTATLAVSGYSAATKLAVTVSKLLAASTPIGWIAGGAVALGGLVTAIGYLTSANADAGKSFEELQTEYEDLQDSYEENQNVIDLVEQYKKLSKEVKTISDLDAGDIELKAKIENSGVTEENLKLIDELKARIETATGEIKQILTIAGAENVTEENIQAIRDLAGAAADGDHELKQALEIAGAKDVTDADIQKIKDLAANAKDEDHRLRQQLALTGIENVTDANLQRIKDLANNSTDGDHELRQQLEILGATDINDYSLGKIKELSANAADGNHSLRQTLAMIGVEDISDDDLARITTLASNSADGDHSLKQQLALLGADDITDEDMARLKELAGSVVTASGTLSETLKLTGFENYEDMKAAAELPLSSKTAEIVVNLGATGYDDLVVKLQEIGSKVVATQQEINGAQATLTELQAKATTLQETIDGTRNRNKRSELQTELDEVNQQIEDQEKIVHELEQTHSDLVTQYNETAAAAAELKTKEDALTAAKEGLSEAIGGVIAKSEEEAIALYEAAAASKAAENALIRKQMYENLQEQAGKYAVAVIDAAEANGMYTDALGKAQTAQEFAGMSVDEINAHYQGLLVTLNEMQKAEGFDPMNADYQATIDQVELMRNALGDFSSDLNQYAGSAVDWVDSFGYLGNNITESGWLDYLEQYNTEIVEYKEQLDSATQVQNDFLDSLTGSVRSGAVTINEIRQRLTQAWKDEENGADLVAGAVEYITKTLEAEAQAAEEAAEATDELKEIESSLSDTTKDQADSLQATIDQINELQKSYEDAYKAAYESMGGQFDLFDKMNKIKPSGNLRSTLNSYTSNLKSQKAYMEDYAKAYADAAAKVQAADSSADGVVANSFMSQLADGSEESAQILANIAKATPEQVEQMIQAYADVQKAKDEYAAAMAEQETNFSESMEALQEDLETAVQALDFSDAAAENAKTALEAFIAQANAYLEPVKAAYKKIADAAAAALEFNPTFDGDLPGYASGTTHAERGLALVGENGPELINFRGGETVLNADETRSAVSAEPMGKSSPGDGNRTITVNVSIPKIETQGMTEHDLMREISYSLKDEIEKVMEELEEDEERRRLG